MMMVESWIHKSNSYTLDSESEESMIKHLEHELEATSEDTKEKLDQTICELFNSLSGILSYGKKISKVKKIMNK